MGLTERQAAALDGIRKYFDTVERYERAGRQIKGRQYNEMRLDFERDVAVLLGYRQIGTWYELPAGADPSTAAELAADVMARSERQKERPAEGKTKTMGRPREIETETAQRAQEMRAEGYSYGVIAARLGIAKTTAYKLANGRR